MKYQTSVSIRGWAGLILGGIGSVYGIAAYRDSTLWDTVGAAATLCFGFMLGISWLRGRKRIRQMQHQAATLRHGLKRMHLYNGGNGNAEPLRMRRATMSGNAARHRPELELTGD